jgi:hypothetical protein
MSDYLVSYDLDKPGQNYVQITQRLERLAFRRLMFSLWVGSGNYPIESLKNDLLQRIDANDRLLVVDITGDSNAGFNLM